mgnify:FL=1
MSGIFYGAGVGPGDPELLTVKALRVMKQCPVIAIPVSDKNFTEAAYDPTGTDPAYKRYLEKCVAYQIAVQADAQIGEKAKLYLPMPMMKEKERLRQVHDEGAEKNSRASGKRNGCGVYHAGRSDRVLDLYVYSQENSETGI